MRLSPVCYLPRLATALGLCLALPGCSPRVITQAARSPAAAMPAPVAPGFVVIKETEPLLGPAEERGDIEIKDAGFTLNCDYEAVLARATKEAQKLGANALKIYEHRLPDSWSTCHRIRAKALRVPDVARYEQEIVWSPARRLARADFKADTASRPFEAATATAIRYHYNRQLFQSQVRFVIETVFDCRNSYFKGRQNPPLTLAHEQGHFDIAELAARRLTQAIGQEVADTQELEQKHEAIYQRIATEAQRMQDKYDSEVYADRSRQPAWLATIAQELHSLQAYASKEVMLKARL